MGRFVAVAAMAGAVHAALSFWLLTGPIVAVLTLAVAVTAAIAAFRRRNPLGIAVGVALVGAGLLVAVMALGTVGGEGGAVDFKAVPEAMRESTLPGLMGLGAVALLLFKWGRFEEEWWGYAIAGGLAVAAVLAFVFPGDGNPMGASAAPGVVALALLAPAILVYRSPAMTDPVRTP